MNAHKLNVSYREKLNKYGEYIVTKVTVRAKGYPAETYSDSGYHINPGECAADYADKYNLTGPIEVWHGVTCEYRFTNCGRIYIPRPDWDTDDSFEL